MFPVMNTIAAQPIVTPSDRLGLTICIALIIHTMVVMGISFKPESISKTRYESLEVILVTQRSEKTPKEADMLAQASMIGGGNSESAERPSASVEAPILADNPKTTTRMQPTEQDTNAEPDPPAVPKTAAESPRTDIETTSDIEEQIVVETPEATLATPEPETRPEPQQPTMVESEEALVKAITPPLPTAAQLITRSFAMASVDAELQQKLELRAQRPRRKFISANTKEFRFAAYMEAWRAKVERVGNINYPDEARRRDLSGSLLLDVALNPDGSVREITIRRSSGQKVLDEAAIRIVELASPFAPFPDDFLREIDILHVTRTWKFLNNSKFSGR